MSTHGQSSTSQYLVLFRSGDWDRKLSVDQVQEVVAKFANWYDWLQQEGRVKSGNPLGETGKVVTGKKGSTVADGPFAESKEAVGGYILLEASSMEEALELANQWPLLEYGGTMEVRPVAAECATIQALNAQLANSSA